MNPGELREIVVAFQKSRIVLTAYELDLFTWIGKKGQSAESISRTLHLHKNATERILNALVALHLLEKKNDRYSNTRDSFMYLSKDSPAYMSGLMHSNHLWDTWSHLTEVVKTGNVAHRAEMNHRGKEWLEAFIHAMHYRGMKQAPSQLSTLDLEQVDSVLDVGGGSGCYCMEFMNRKPGLKTDLFDLPNVLPVSEKIMEKEGYAGKIGLYSGDYRVDVLPEGYDLVFLSAIIHSNSYETNRELVEKCYRSLRPDGRIVIQDWIMNNAKTEPVQGAIFSINMLVGVEGGDCYAEEEVRAWMEHTGFTAISKITLPTGLAQMTGVKKDR